MTTINLTLNNHGINTFANHLSSDNYNELVQSGLSPLDLLYTFIYRYAKVIEVDIPNNGSNSNGLSIDYAGAHPVVSTVTTLLFLGVAAASMSHEYKKQQTKKCNNNYHYLYQQFHNMQTAELGNLLPPHDINYYLNLVHQNDLVLQKKYRTIKIEKNDGAVEFKFESNECIVPKKKTFAERAKNLVLNTADVGFTTLSIASFVYWILWIGAGVFTGVLPSVGISLLPKLVEFGVPIVTALVYPIVKMANWIRRVYKPLTVAPLAEPQPDLSSNEKNILQQSIAEQAPEITAEAVSVLRRALLIRDFDLKRARLVERLKLFNQEPDVYVRNVNAKSASLDNSAKSLGQNRIRKTAVTLLSATAGMFVAVQYGSWIVTDLLSLAFNITVNATGLGVALLAIAGVCGLYKAYKRYHEVKAEKAKHEVANKALGDNLVDLESELHSLQASIATKNMLLNRAPKPAQSIKHNEEQFFVNIHKQGPSKWTFTKKALTRAYHFINGFCTGAFMARIFFVAKSAIALPFAAAAFSTPVTIAIVVGIGLAYAAFKAYEYHQARQEARVKEVRVQHAERLECLQQEVQLAKLELQVLVAEVAAMPKAPVVPAREQTHKPVTGWQLGFLNRARQGDAHQPLLRDAAVHDSKSLQLAG